jgi:lipopolysaccharide export system permease protein
MILRRAFYREAALATLGITVVLLVALVLAGFTTLLGRAVRGDLAEDIVLALLGWQTLRRLDLLLPLALYLGILLTLNRWYSDSEMTVLAACGVGLWRLLRPVLLFALAVATLVALGAFYATPLASRQMEQLRAESAARLELSRLEPGVFNPLPGSGRVFYAERIDPASGALEGVFIGSLEQGRQGVVIASAGEPYAEPGTGERFLVLRAGSLYDGAPGEAGYRVMDFEAYHLRLRPLAAAPPAERIDGLRAAELLARTDGAAAAEWHWRLSKPVVAMVLALFALALAYTDARRGRLGNLFAAILVYFIYSNMLALAQTLLKKGQVPDALGLWWVHAIMLVIALYLLARRAQHRPLFALPFLRS